MPDGVSPGESPSPAGRLDVATLRTLAQRAVDHYVEEREAASEPYQCRWDRHPKTTAPRTHFHPPPDAGDAEASSLDPHHLEVLFTVLDWVSGRVEALHNQSDPSGN